MMKKESHVYFGYREVKNEYFIKWENNRSEAYKEYRRKSGRSTEKVSFYRFSLLTIFLIWKRKKRIL